MEKPILLSGFDGVFNVFGNDNFTPEEATTDKNTYHGYSAVQSFHGDSHAGPYRRVAKGY